MTKVRCIKKGRNMISRKVLSDLKNGMEKHALTLDPSSARAQCYTIASYEFDGDETIAERLLRDHANLGHALRAARLICDAGLPNKKPNFFGTYIFGDGSEL